MHYHLAVQHVHRTEKLPHDSFLGIYRQGFFSFVELVCQHFIAVFKDAVDVFSCRALVVLKNVKQSHKLVIIYQLSKQTNLAHGAVVYPIGHVLNKVTNTALTSNKKVFIATIIPVGLCTHLCTSPYVPFPKTDSLL